MSHTVLFAANRGYALSNSRDGLIRWFLSSGWRVVLATAQDAYSTELVRQGAELAPVDFNRGGFVVAADWLAYRRMAEIYREFRPSLAQHFNAKPVITGTLAARRMLGNQVQVFNTITGLGHAFVAGGITARLAGFGYRFSLPGARATVFQNSDDRDLFLRSGWLAERNAHLIVGSGVDLQRFAFIDRAQRADKAPVVVMVGRLLKQKGIPEFVDMARRIRTRYPDARFILAGEEDLAHPDSVSVEWVSSHSDIEYVGHLSDIVPFLQQADLLLFPSSYREGMPRVVIEASATGLPTVAFDVPGVREAVRHEETGYLCPDRDVDTLAHRVSELIADGDRRLAMGRAAREMAERLFDIEVVQNKYLALYREASVSI